MSRQSQSVEHRYNTRQAAQVQLDTPATLQIVAGTALCQGRGPALAASSLKAQETFLKGVGMITTDVEPLEEILSSRDAELLSCALKHRRVTEMKLTDPYFTDEEWERVLDNRAELLDDAEDLLALGTSTQEKAGDWIERKKRLPLCACEAHKCNSDFFTDILGVLVTLQPPLNDDSGNVFFSVFLTHVLKVADLTRLTVRGTRGGTLGSVRYILRLPSGTEYVYTGWPDLQIYQKFSYEKRQLGEHVGLEETVRGVGEVQSPPGTSNAAKNRAFTQAGIYTLGHFNNTTNVSKLATVVLYKDFTAHVALATIRRAEGGRAEGIIGDVTYKLVHGVNTFDLRAKEDIQTFSSVFIATLKTTLL